MIQIAAPENAPIPSPEAEELKKQCTLLSNELADLIAEKDGLTMDVIPNITAQYASTVGARECECFRLEVEIRHLKRILEHIQAVENHGNRANLEQIEAGVENELKGWNEKLLNMVNQVHAGQDHLKNSMTIEQSDELRELYRELARRLHPDVNLDFADKHRVLWARVQEAHRLGNIEEMQALKLLVEDIPDDISLPNALEFLRKRYDRLRTSITTTLEQIDRIKTSPPFELLKKLETPDWVATRLVECEKKSERLVLRKEDLSAKLEAWKQSNG